VIRDGRAAGVRLASGDIIDAGRVVLAAGAYNSPQILHRTGIGPREVLASIGVESLLEVPGVGENLLDHVSSLVILEAERKAVSEFLSIGPALKLRTAPGLVVEDVKFTFLPGDLFGLPGMNGFFIEVSNCESQGVVRAISRDPQEGPDIDHRYFSEPKDLDRMVGGAKVAIEVAKVMSDTIKCDVLLPDPESARDEEALRRVLQAGRMAGSAKNTQPCRFIVLALGHPVAGTTSGMGAQRTPLDKMSHRERWGS